MDSKAYWAKREHEAQKKYIKQEQEYIKELNRYYDNAMDAAQKEIDSFYAKYAGKEGITLSEAKKRVSKLDIEEYSRKAAKYVKNKDFSKQANEEMRLYNATMKINRLEMLKSMIGLEMVGSIDEMQKYFDEKLTQRTIDEFDRQAGILGKSVGDPKGNAKSIVNASFHNANFSSRLWTQQVMLKSELSMLLQRGMIQGKSSRQLAPELKKMFGVKKYEAERLMRTELTRARTAAQMQSFEENGFDRYMFINFASAPYTKNPVCEICEDIGNRCEEEKGFLVKDMMPGENAPPMHPGCRCSVSAYMDREEFDKWLDEKPPKPLKNEGESGIMESDERGLFILDKDGNRLRCEIDEIPPEQLATMKEKNGWYVDWRELSRNNDIYGLYTDDGKLQSAMACRVDKEANAIYANWIIGNPDRSTRDVGQPLLARAMGDSIDAGFGGIVMADASNKKLVEYYVEEWGAEFTGLGSGFGVAWSGYAVLETMKKYGMISE